MRMSKLNSKKILIVGPSWVGDMIMAQALFKLLKQHDDTVIIDVLAPAWSNAVIAQMPEVRRVLPMSIGHGELKLSERYRIARELRAEKYDQAIVLPNSWKSALIPWLAKIPKRTGWHGEMRYGLLNDLRQLDESKITKMVERYLALALPKNSDVPNIRPSLMPKEHEVLQTVAKYNINTGKNILALCPGAEYGPAKQWPAAHHAKLALEKIKEGWQVWLLGSKNDAPIADEIQRETNNACINFTGRTNLVEAIHLLSQATVVVSNDSGLMHMASALAKPVVAIYGSTPEHFAPPLCDRAKILSLSLPCRPCRQRVCPLQHLNCLKGISSAVVADTINELISVN